MITDTSSLDWCEVVRDGWKVSCMAQVRSRRVLVVLMLNRLVPSASASTCLESRHVPLIAPSFLPPLPSYPARSQTIMRFKSPPHHLSVTSWASWPPISTQRVRFDVAAVPVTSMVFLNAVETAWYVRFVARLD